MSQEPADATRALIDEFDKFGAERMIDTPISDATRAFIDEFEKCEQKMAGGRLGVDIDYIREAIRNNPEGAKGFIDFYCYLAKNTSPRHIKLAYLVAHYYVEIFNDDTPLKRVGTYAIEFGAEEHLIMELVTGDVAEFLKCELIGLTNDKTDSSRDPQAIALRQHVYLISNRIKQAIELVNNGDWGGIVKLWEPFLGTVLFNADIKVLYGNYSARVGVHTAKWSLFMAHVQLGMNLDKYHWREAVRFLRELLQNEPYSDKSGANQNTDMSKASRDAQNLNYKDALTFADGWFDHVGGIDVVSGITDIPESDLQRVSDEVKERLKELEVELKAE